jgi:HEAT repeat protein
MSRFLLLSTLAFLALLVPGRAVRADDDDPVFERRKLSEWVEMLRGEKDLAQRQTALLALGGGASHPHLWENMFLRRRAGLFAVELIGPVRGRQVLPAITLALREDPDERIRSAAALALGGIFDKVKAEKYVIPALRLEAPRDALVGALRNDKSGQVREAAAFALSKVRGETGDGVVALAAALKDEYPAVRAKAADALRRLGRDARDAMPELRQALSDKTGDRVTRIQVALAIGRIGPPEALAGVPELTEVLADPKTPKEVRTATAESLGQLGRDAAVGAIPALAAALTAKDSPVEVRRAAAAALDQFGPDARPALPALQKALTDADKFVRCQAMHALGRMGKELGPETSTVVTALLRGLDDSVIEVRVAAIETLGNLGSEALGADTKAVVTRLTEATRDSQKAIRDAAADALKKLKGAP